MSGEAPRHAARGGGGTECAKHSWKPPPFHHLRAFARQIVAELDDPGMPITSVRGWLFCITRLARGSVARIIEQGWNIDARTWFAI
jgi:hypothetical protein